MYVRGKRLQKGSTHSSSSALQQRQPKVRPTQEKIGLKVAYGPRFSPQQVIFRGLGLILYRKQTTRNPTQPNSPQAP